jgi:hypothetical protein
MKRKRLPIHQIELRIGSLPELFNSMDPTPFHRRDLDAAAEEFIESWALEFPQNSHFRIMVHIEQAPPEDASRVVAAAIHNYFNYKAELLKRNVKVLLLEGRTSLMIGLVFLAACLLGADTLSAHVGSTFLRVLKESLLIGGWVAMWRPMQVFLYDWWPLVRRARIYRSLGSAIVHVSQVKNAAPGDPSHA